MKKPILFNSFRAAFVLAFALSVSQVSFGQQWPPSWPGLPAWGPPPTFPDGTGDSQPALNEASPWALGGNSVQGIGAWAGMINNVMDQSTNLNGNNLKFNSIGTVDGEGFIMKANNLECIFITPVGQVGLGWNNTNGGAPVDIWSSVYDPSDRTRLSFYPDYNGNIESDGNMTLIFNPAGFAFYVKEGSFNGGSVTSNGHTYTHKVVKG